MCNPVWIDGQGITTVDELWQRIGDVLHVYTGYETGTSDNESVTARVTAEGTILPGFAKLTGGGDYSGANAETRTYSIARPINTVAKDALLHARRPLVIDDFHFVARDVQRTVVRALKPAVFAGVPIVFASVSHRVQDVVTAEPDMTGRVYPLDIAFWTDDELLVIARKGFEVLRVTDPDDRLASRLAEMSFGSPHLMQKFCRELCKENDVREARAAHDTLELDEPPSWEGFFEKQTEEASASWFQRLLRGPQERGSTRTQWALRDGRSLDGYGLTLASIASTGPKLSLTKDEIKTAVEALVVAPGPAANQTTRVLQHMTRIAAKRATEAVPTEDELDAAGAEPDAVPDVQPVLEYLEDGPSSALHLADPFFAFYLRWGSPRHLTSQP